MLMSKIIESKALDPSLFNRIGKQDALNAVFLADPTIDILVWHRGETRLLDYELSGDLEEDVRTLRTHKVVQYVHKEKRSPFYCKVNLEKMRNADAA